MKLIGKKENLTEKDNYQPISTVSNISKVSENIDKYFNEILPKTEAATGGVL